MNTVANVGLHTLPFFATRVNQVPQFAEAQKETLATRWAWLNREISDGRPHIAGDTFSVADITGMTALKICDIVELSVPDDLSHVKKWEAAVRSRPSWTASGSAFQARPFDLRQIAHYVGHGGKILPAIATGAC
ncbi:MAG: hypothetical protein HKN05_15515 [Rhizobiales bacterium]|nr:hypothetical protein [Hyphomicrobiales bacterium]